MALEGQPAELAKLQLAASDKLAADPALGHALDNNNSSATASLEPAGSEPAAKMKLNGRESSPALRGRRPADKSSSASSVTIHHPRDQHPPAAAQADGAPKGVAGPHTTADDEPPARAQEETLESEPLRERLGTGVGSASERQSVKRLTGDQVESSNQEQSSSESHSQSRKEDRGRQSEKSLEREGNRKEEANESGLEGAAEGSFGLSSSADRAPDQKPAATTTTGGPESRIVAGGDPSSSSSSAPPPPQAPPVRQAKFAAPNELLAEKRARRLSYLQSLLLRKWPCLALTICIMSSLLFGTLLSALTVYLMHGATDCGQLALAAASAAAGSTAGHHPLSHELLRPQEFSPHDTPLEPVGASVAAVAALDAPEQLTSRQLLGAPEAADSRPRFQRLPSAVWPDHYDLFVWPHITGPHFNFTGRVDIQIKCREATDNITLHTLDLELDAASARLVELAEGSPTTTAAATAMNKMEQLPVREITSDKQLQYSILHLNRKLRPGRDYILTLNFAGYLNDDLAGFYKIRYERPNSTEPVWIAATQFQATDARRAFPCFDEPLYKATFSIKIKHWNNMTALSNMPIVARENSSDGLWVTDTFAKSHRMSTYLVAYAVTNFESRSESNITVWTRPGLVHTAEYSLKIAGQILRYYEQFFGIEYPLPKMDMIALPDFNAGAMENWGLITYRETAMLYDESSSSVANKQRVAVVVAHELAHQWFGNLVTPKWWDDLWLNEGFASFVEYIGVDHVEPKWRMLDQFVVEEVQNVFKVDGLSSSHQISIPVNNPDEISEIFDHISYAKGASIIRMMSHFLTEPVLKLGLQRYLRALKYSNAEQSDLWAHLTEAQRLLGSANRTTVNVERVMHSWTLQTGYPLVRLTRDYNQPSRVELEQARYMPFKSNLTGALFGSATAAANQSRPQRWEIPITFTWRSEQDWSPRTRLWMHQNEPQPVEVANFGGPAKGPSADDWVILNVNQVGYYRVNYDQRNWQLLVEQLNANHSKISTINRAQLLDDIFELAKSALLDYKFAMEATRYLRGERDYLPWDTVLMSFSYIDDMLQRTPIYGLWKDYIANLIEPYYARYRELDWHLTAGNSSQRQKRPDSQGQTGPLQVMDSNDVLEQYNQVNAVAWACQVNEHCIGRARAVFGEWRRWGSNKINPALRYTTYCTAIENGDKTDWDFLWAAYEREQSASERDRIMRALGCSKEIWILARYLDWTFNKTKPIRRQDGAYVFRMIAKNNYGRDIAFNFMRERWATVKEFYGKTSFSMGNLIRSVATSMNTQVELDQLKSFYETVKADVGTGKRAFQIAIEEVESNVAWRNRNYKMLDDWLQLERSRRQPPPAA